MGPLEEQDEEDYADPAAWRSTNASTRRRGVPKPIVSANLIIAAFCANVNTSFFSASAVQARLLLFDTLHLQAILCVLCVSGLQARAHTSTRVLRASRRWEPFLANAIQLCPQPFGGTTSQARGRAIPKCIRTIRLSPDTFPIGSFLV